MRRWSWLLIAGLLSFPCVVRPAPMTRPGVVRRGLPEAKRGEENPMRAYRRHFIAPRAYPDSLVHAADRESALVWYGHLPVARFGLNDIAARPQWKSIGPTNVGGRVTAIAIDVPSTNRWFVTTVGGVWRSLDGGASWRRVSDPPDPQDPDAMRPGVFAAVAIVPGTNEVLVGGGDPNRFELDRAGGPGVWHSLEGGNPGSWTREPAPDLLDAIVFKLRVDPGGDHDVYAATSKGLYWRHHDATGATLWERFPGFATPCSDVVIDDRVLPRRLIVGAYKNGSRVAGIWRRDSGTWTNVSPNFGGSDPGPIALALSASNRDVVFARVSQRGGWIWDAPMLGVFRSWDGGATWADVTPATPAMSQQAARASACGGDVNVVGWDADADNPPYAGFNSTIEIDPQNPQVVYCGGISLLRSEDGGQSWCRMVRSAHPAYHDDTAGAAWEFRNAYAHDDVHAVAFDFLGGRRVVVGDDGGLHGLNGDLMVPLFYWSNLAHGLDVTEFYRLATQQAPAAVVAGGTQDNGGLTTYGNRTWYRADPCDVQDMALDAPWGGTYFGHCNYDEEGRPLSLWVYPSLIPGTAAWSAAPLGTSPDVYPPIAVDRETPRHALAVGLDDEANASLYASVNGTDWSPVSGGSLPAGTEVTALAKTHDALGDGFYAGFANDALKSGHRHAGMRSLIPPATSATLVQSPLPDARPNAIAVDPGNPRRAVVAMNGTSGTGNLVLTSDGGVSWNVLPIQSPALGVAFDPFDAQVLYVATDVGVLRGTLSGASPPTLSVEQANLGLPGPISVNDIRASSAGILTIGTMGYGAWQLDLRPEAIARDVALCVRDDVFDRGNPFVSGLPDPEHPVLDPTDSRYYVAASGGAGLQPYASTDIRLDEPALAPVRNRVERADHVAFESTPTQIGDGFPGTIVDRAPSAGGLARVMVQVTNLGRKAAHDVRVFAMWHDATLAPTTLPADFWTVTLPAIGSPCGPLDESTGWHPLASEPPGSGSGGGDCTTQSVTLPEVRPEMPEVATFYWRVPVTAAGHACVVAMVESREDPIPEDVRMAGRLDVGALVPQQRQFAQRNLNVIDVPPGQYGNLEIVGLPSPLDPGDAVFSLRFARPWLTRDHLVGVMLPAATHGSTVGVRSIRPSLALRTAALAQGLEPTLFVADSAASAIEDVRLKKGAPARMLLFYASTGKERTAAARTFRVSAVRDSVLLGSATWILRPSARRIARAR